MFGIFGADGRRAKAARRASGPLADYYAATPFPEPSTPVADLKLLAIDLETTGLDPAKDTMLSVGFVPVDGDTIMLSGARHMVLQADCVVGQSAIHHGLTDDMIASGQPREEVLAATLAALSGRVLLAHYARIEVDFISGACEQVYGAPFVPPVIDTLVLHERIAFRGYDDEARGNALRLWTARGRYGLPRYAAHEALTDSLACAELYLAQVAEYQTLRQQTFKTLRSG